MKNSLTKLRGFAVHKHDAKNIRDHQPYGAQLDEFNRAWQVSVAAISPKRFPLHLVTESDFPHKSGREVEVPLSLCFCSIFSLAFRNYFFTSTFLPTEQKKMKGNFQFLRWAWGRSKQLDVPCALNMIRLLLRWKNILYTKTYWAVLYYEYLGQT